MQQQLSNNRSHTTLLLEMLVPLSFEKLQAIVSHGPLEIQLLGPEDLRRGANTQGVLEATSQVKIARQTDGHNDITRRKLRKLVIEGVLVEEPLCSGVAGFRLKLAIENRMSRIPLLLGISARQISHPGSLCRADGLRRSPRLPLEGPTATATRTLLMLSDSYVICSLV